MELLSRGINATTRLKWKLNNLWIKIMSSHVLWQPRHLSFPQIGMVRSTCKRTRAKNSTKSAKLFSLRVITCTSLHANDRLWIIVCAPQSANHRLRSLHITTCKPSANRRLHIIVCVSSCVYHCMLIIFWESISICTCLLFFLLFLLLLIQMCNCAINVFKLTTPALLKTMCAQHNTCFMN